MQQYLDSGHSMFKVILNYTNICLVPCKNSWSVKSRWRMKMLSCILLSWLFQRKADIVHSYLGLLKVFSFDKSSPVNFLKEIILRITKILRMQRSKDQTRQSSEKFRIFLISCLSQESRVVAAVVRCCWLWYRRYEGQASDVLTFPCYTISLSWHNDISPASDWSLLACSDLWLASRGQDRHRYRPQHDTSKRPSHFLLPGFRGEVHHRIFPQTEDSVWRAWVGEVTPDIVCVLC